MHTEELLEDPTGYGRKVGERLRAIRRQKGLSLQDVEASSSQEFKASVLGAYERGERAISVPRLERLARFYSVPVDQLLPREEGDTHRPDILDLTEATAHEGRAALTIDLTRLRDLESPESEMLVRYLQMIQVQRQDFNGRMLTVRRDDLRAIACILDTSVEHAVGRLDDLGLCLADLTQGVYLHIPFCATRCDYCTFATWTDRHHLIERYLAACRADITRAVDDGVLPPASSVFVGGGTPSLVDADALAGVLAALPITAGAEVTIECNPDSIDARKLHTYVAAGVNRISCGVQSMVPHVLAALGRTHDPDNVFAAVRAARAAGVPSLNLDLIYGAVGETLDDWSRTVDAAIALEPEHISAYTLTVEPGTALADDPARYPDDDDQADKYTLVTDRLTAAGYDWYEISNWARPGHECRHNLLYWTQGDYHGFGCAAHSHRAGRRWWNVRTPDRYVEAIESGASPVAGDETLDDDGRRLEGLQLALRTRGGVPASALPLTDDIAALVDVRDGQVTLTEYGRFLANEVALRLRYR